MQIRGDRELFFEEGQADSELAVIRCGMSEREYSNSRKSLGIGHPSLNRSHESEDVSQRNTGNKTVRDYKRTGVRGEDKKVLCRDLATGRKGNQIRAVKHN
jgi:hypothetical protein